MNRKTKEGVGLITLTAVSVGLGYVLANKFPSPIFKDWWDIGSTVGTLGAVVVALYFGLGNERRARREAHTAAVIVAARLVDHVTALLNKLAHFEGHCKARPNQCAENPGFLESMVFEWRESRLLLLSPQDLLALSALKDGDAAVFLARGLAFLDQIASQRSALLTAHSDFTAVPHKERFVSVWSGMAGQAIHFLKLAGDEMAKAVSEDRLWGPGTPITRVVHDRVLQRASGDGTE